MKKAKNWRLILAKIEYSRNIILSLIVYLEPLLAAENYSFAFVPSWGSDEKIVLPQDEVSGSNQIVLPAGKFTVNTRSKGGYLEVGGTTMESMFFGGLFIHAVSEGQAYDLLDFIHDRIESGDSLQLRGDNRIIIYDFSTTGYPPADIGATPQLGKLEMRDVRHRYISDLSSENAAMNHAGDITFVGMIYVS